MDSYLPSLISLKEQFFDNSFDQYWIGSSKKFNINGVINWVNFDRLKKVITDEYINQETINNLKIKGVEVLIVKL
jgi:DeoR/GlpR family transcriptional regulator of sugar metabolism